MSDLYRLTKTQMVEGSMHAMNGGTYMGHLVPVSIDYEAAERALTEWVDDGMDGFWMDAAELIVDAALGGDDETL